MPNKESQSSNQQKSILRLFLTGFGMGTADLIPGVSGGTIAFISGIYQELLYSIKVISGKALQLLMQGKMMDAIQATPIRFLIPLFAGIFAAVFTLARLLSYLLHDYPIFVFAFFFGLVLASTWLVLKRVVSWQFADVFGFIAAAIFAYFLVGSVPVVTPSTMLMFFISGMLAISAMILPGISGSFILLLLGKYDQILTAAKDVDIITLGIFMAGAVVGLALFSRVLSWLFSKYHDISVAILAGFMFGSVRKLWPWKNVLETRIDSHGEVVPLLEQNILPAQLDGTVLFAILLGAIGIGLILYVDSKQGIKEHTEDIDSNKFKQNHVKALKQEK